VHLQVFVDVFNLYYSHKIYPTPQLIKAGMLSKSCYFFKASI